MTQPQISQARLAANRRNAQNSTGPRTAGKERSRLNAVTHGLTAQIPVLPGEDLARFQAKVDGYKSDLQPQGTLENDLVEQMAQQAWQIERALTADAARVTIKIQTNAAETAVRDADQAAALGQRLFFDRRGPTPLFPSVKLMGRNSPRTSRIDQPDDPDDPARLLILLESNTAGCRFLLDCWAALRDRIETGQCWQSPEKLRAIRLMGRQPHDCADDRDVAELLLACHVLDPQHKQAFSEVRSEMDDDEWKAYARRLEGRNYIAITPADPTAARAVLLGIVDKATRRLNLLATTHQERDAQVAALNVHALAFDDTPEGERLRRYKNACDRAYHRTIATLLKVRKEVEIADSDTAGADDDTHKNESDPSSAAWGQTASAASDTSRRPADPAPDSSAFHRPPAADSDHLDPTAGGNGDLVRDSAASHLVPEPQHVDDSQRVLDSPDEEAHDLRNEATGAALDATDGEPAAGAQDPARDIDMALYDALEITLDRLRDQGVESQGIDIDLDLVKQKIVAHAREVVRWAEVETFHDSRNEAIGADDDDHEGEPAAGVVDRVNSVDVAYRDTLSAAMARIRDPDAGSQDIDIDMEPLKKAIEAQARDFLRQEELKKALEYAVRHPNYYRADEPHPEATSPRPGDLRPAGGKPEARPRP